MLLLKNKNSDSVYRSSFFSFPLHVFYGIKKKIDQQFLRAIQIQSRGNGDTKYIEWERNIKENVKIK